MNKLMQAVQKIAEYRRAARVWGKAQNDYVASFRYGRSLKDVKAIEKYTPFWEAAAERRDNKWNEYFELWNQMQSSPKIVRLIANIVTHHQWSWSW